MIDSAEDEFEKWYNETYRTKPVDTKHINDSEAAFRAGISYMERVNKEWLAELQKEVFTKMGFTLDTAQP